jgi:hypothetical protein
VIGTLRAAPGMLNGLGLPVVVYDRHSLQTTAAGQVDVTELVLTADAAIGATSLAVAHVSGAKMTGRLPAGLALTIGAAEMALAADVEPNRVAGFSLPVPALTAALGDGAVVELAKAVELPYIFRPRSSKRMFAPGAGIVTGKVRGTLTWSPPMVEGQEPPPPIRPPMGALLQGEEIFNVDAVLGGNTAWRVEAGEMVS